jgi:hypothetical protein
VGDETIKLLAEEISVERQDGCVSVTVLTRERNELRDVPLARA